MVYERLPVFDEASVADALDGDRELLFEILGLHRQSIRRAVEALADLTPTDPEFRTVLEGLVDTAERIGAVRLEELSKLLLLTHSEIDLPIAARGRIVREAERFLRETQLVL